MVEPSYNLRLGVCIPTYKRPDQLQKCVNSVITAAEPHRVPVFIVDDSTDGTNNEVMASLRARYPHIVYERNAQNLGIDGNILKAVNACTCDFAWLLGEDDRMLPDAISLMLDRLQCRADPPAFVCTNYSFVDERILLILRERLIPICQDGEMPADEFLRTHAWAIGFIGSCVINTARWRKIDQTQYVGTYYAHVGTIMESVAGGKVALVARPLILNRVGGAGVVTWSNQTYSVFNGWEEMTNRLIPVYGAETCGAAAESFRANTGYGSLRFLCSRRADKIYDITIYNKLIRGSAEKRRGYKLAARLIAHMPPSAFHLTRALKYQLAKRKSRMLSGFS